jgi:hypothetical protein
MFHFVFTFANRTFVLFSTIALSKLFLLSDQRLQGINVQGEIIVPAGGRMC